MRIVDTHLHLVYKDRFTYPWLDGAPAINRQWDAGTYFAEATPLGIEAALHMEVDVADSDIEAESSFMATLHPRIVGAIAACRPESPDFAAQLDRLTAIARLKGVRRVLHTQPDELSASPTFIANVRRLAMHRLPFDLCVLGRQLDIGRQLAAACPDVQFILDHCGVPDIAGGDFNDWAKAIRSLAELPNVAAKVSGVIAYGKSDWTAQDIAPYVEHVIDSFGWDRIVWGSDYPVCTLTADLTRWVDLTQQIIAGASESEKAKLLYANAERLYRLS